MTESEQWLDDLETLLAALVVITPRLTYPEQDRMRDIFSRAQERALHESAA